MRPAASAARRRMPRSGSAQEAVELVAAERAPVLERGDARQRSMRVGGGGGGATARRNGQGQRARRPSMWIEYLTPRRRGARAPGAAALADAARGRRGGPPRPGAARAAYAAPPRPRRPPARRGSVWPILRGSTSTKARTGRPRARQAARPRLADRPRAPHHDAVAGGRGRAAGATRASASKNRSGA